MVPDILMNGVVASYLSSPGGMELIQNYLASQEGHAAIRNYLATPRGKKMAQDLLPLILDAVDLPGDITKLVLENYGKKN
jgi:hypothetical protein